MGFFGDPKDQGPSQPAARAGSGSAQGPFLVPVASGLGDVDQSDANDRLRMGGHLLPGEIDLSDITRALAKQHKRGSGDDGAEPHFKGLKVTDFTITLSLHNDAQWDAWRIIRPLLIDYKDSAKRNQVSIDYPLLAEAEITAVIVHQISTKKPKGGGPIVVTISCSSAKVKSGASNKPKASRYVIRTAGGLVPYAPGIILTSVDRYNDKTLNVRSATALEQARIDNGIAIAEALDNRKVAETTLVNFVRTQR